ncbi:hypothetical protein TWF730_002448 [Orbilia blumenaviensis]|uniref:Uncharacterized protein n=1 Tax=Orbilia blumenaviensis TaxID=1796055 RepID=A0AAV9UA35_9PEZI
MYLFFSRTSHIKKNADFAFPIVPGCTRRAVVKINQKIAASKTSDPGKNGTRRFAFDGEALFIEETVVNGRPFFVWFQHPRGPGKIER